MAKKKPGPDSAEVLAKAKPSRAHNVIISFKDCPLVPPAILREWLEEQVEMFSSAASDLNTRKDEIAQAENAERLQATSIMLNCLDFLDQAEAIEPLLSDDQPPEVAISFTQGLRLGMLHERLLSLADDRFKRQWVREDILDKNRPQPNKAEQKAKAEAVLEKYRKRMPNRTLTVQKEHAAEELGTSVRNLNRWLKG